jgi:hypothetical protein
VASIEADFRVGRLIVRVRRSGWGGLDADQQRRFAQDMLERSHELDFAKLEIADEQGTLLARSPVVGNHMVIFAGSKI